MPAVMEGPLRDLNAWNPVGCSIAKALDLVGNKTVLLILREAYYGTTRFESFARRVAVTDAVLAKHLRKMADIGLLERRPYQNPGQRTRHEYVLAPMGRDLVPVVFALWQWGNKYLQEDGGPLHVVDHSGAQVRVGLRSDRDLDLEDVHVRVNRAWLRKHRPRT